MFKKILSLGAIYYTVASAVLLVFSAMLDGGTTMLAPSRFLLLLLCAYVMSLGTGLNESFSNTVAGRVCHAICYIGGFFFCILLPYNKGFAFTVIATALFSTIYAAVCIIKSIAMRKHKQNVDIKPNENNKKAKNTKPNNKKTAKTEYKSLFSDGKDGTK